MTERGHAAGGSASVPPRRARAVDSDAQGRGWTALALRAGALLQHLTDWALVVTVGGQFAVLVLQVFTRYVLNRPIGWSEEVALHLFIWMTFLGAAYGTRLRSHPRVAVVGAWERGALPWLVPFQKAVAVVFLVGLGGAGAALAVANQSILSPNAEISQLFLYGAAPVGALLMLVEMCMPAAPPAPAGAAR
ncbi:MAG: TRAP transporter small permease [Chloroflexi bacterium]|nr:TRAP transporter small permease [Chloroflexota bacterium]